MPCGRFRPAVRLAKYRTIAIQPNKTQLDANRKNKRKLKIEICTVLTQSKWLQNYKMVTNGYFRLLTYEMGWLYSNIRRTTVEGRQSGNCG